MTSSFAYQGHQLIAPPSVMFGKDTGHCVWHRTPVGAQGPSQLQGHLSPGLLASKNVCLIQITDTAEPWKLDEAQGRARGQGSQPGLQTGPAVV
jgi:hypothetical protein